MHPRVHQSRWDFKADGCGCPMSDPARAGPCTGPTSNTRLTAECETQIVAAPVTQHRCLRANHGVEWPGRLRHFSSNTHVFDQPENRGDIRTTMVFREISVFRFTARISPLRNDSHDGGLDMAISIYLTIGCGHLSNGSGTGEPIDLPTVHGLPSRFVIILA